MPSFVQDIYDFNLRAGLLDRPYNDSLEASFQIEEALEDFDLSQLAVHLGTINKDPKTISRAIVSACNISDLSDVARLDKACDAIVFAFGSIFKLGLTPDQAAKAISIVMSANLAKLGQPRDSEGKLLKPDSFVGPEEQLALLFS